MLAKEEELEDQQSQYEKSLKDKTKIINSLTEELTQAIEKTSSLQKRLLSIEETCSKDVKDLEHNTKRAKEQWAEQKRTLDGILFQIQARNEQCIDFIESIKKDQASLGPLIEQKICHYFNAAFQQLSSDEQQNSHVSVKDTRLLLNTVMEGTKRAIDSLIKRSEQFLKLHRNSIQNQKQALHSVASQATMRHPTDPNTRKRTANKRPDKMGKYLRPNSTQSFPHISHESHCESLTSRQDAFGAFNENSGIMMNKGSDIDELSDF